MYKIIGMNETDVMHAENFAEALKLFHEHCIEPIARGQKSPNSDNIVLHRSPRRDSNRSHELSICIRIRCQSRFDQGR